MFLLWCYLPWYVYRSMRVVYGEGRFKTLLKFFAHRRPSTSCCSASR